MLIVACGSLQAQDLRYGKVSKEEIEETAHPLEPEADAAILFRDTYVHFDYFRNQGFNIITEVVERVKIYNKDGFDYATKSIGLYKSGSTKEYVNGLKGVTYNLVDGKIEETKLKNDGIFDEERSDYLDVKKFTMPDIKEGSVIEYKYTVTSPFLSNIDEMRLQEEIPINIVNARMYAPEYFGLKRHSKGWRFLNVEETTTQKSISFTYTESRGGNFQNDKVTYTENIYKIEEENVPSIKEEAYCGNIDNYLSSIKFELAYTKFPNEPIKPIATSWEDVAKTIYDSDAFGGELHSSRFYSDDIDPYLAKAATPSEKMLMIFEFVKSKMNWNGHYGLYAENGIRRAYKEASGNSGDINLLLVAMLRYAGLEANPVITSTKSNGIPIFPTRNGFNYVLASVDLAGGTALLDATNKLASVNLLEDEIINWSGRIIKEDGSSQVISLSPSKPASHRVMAVVEIGDDLSTKGKLRQRSMGNYAHNERMIYKSKNDDERRMNLEENFQGIEIHDLAFAEMENVYKPVSTEYEFDSMDQLEEIGGKLYFSPMFHLTTSENPFKSEERKYPVDFIYPREQVYSFTVNIPDGYEVESLPENLKIAMIDNAGEFVYQITQSSNTLQLHVKSAINESMFPPDKYVDLKKFYDMMIAKEGEKVVLKKI